MVNADFSRRCKLFQGKNYRLFAGTDFLRGQAIDYLGGGGKLQTFREEEQVEVFSRKLQMSDFCWGDADILRGQAIDFFWGGGATDFQGEDYRLLQEGAVQVFSRGESTDFFLQEGERELHALLGGGIHVHRRGKLQTFSGGRSTNEHTEIFILLNKIS